MCDWYFTEEDYFDALEDEIIRRIRAEPFLSQDDKKELIICWYYEVERRSAGDLNLPARVSALMKSYLKRHNLHTFEESFFDQPF